MALTPAPAILNQRLVDHLSRRFNCDFIIQHPVDSSDGQGGTTRDWTLAPLEVLGAMHQLTGEEREAQGALGDVVTHEILIAYLPGVDVTQRILYGTRVFDIKSVDDYAEQHLLLGLLVAERFRK